MSAVEYLYIIDTALNRVQFPLCNWLEINKTKYSPDGKTLVSGSLTTPSKFGWIHPVQRLIDGVQRWIHPVQILVDGVQRWIHPVQILVNGVQRWIHPVQRLVDGVQRWINKVGVYICTPLQPIYL
ncbi:MAG: hypothetical protein ACYTXC_15245 [Nostoc sp.]